MEQVGGPVVAIALILAAVFIPTAAVPGITGRLVSAVRDHHCHLGADLGLQRADAQPRACLAAAEAEGKGEKPWSAWVFFDWFNRVFGRTRAIRRDLRFADSQVGFAMLVLLGVAFCAGWMGARLPRRVYPARKTRATSSSACSCRMRPQLQRTDEALQKCRRAVEDARRRGHQSASTASACSAYTEHLYRLLLRLPETWDLRKCKDEQFKAIQQTSPRDLAASGRHRVLLPAAGHSGRRHVRRRFRGAGGSLGGDDCVYLTENWSLHGRASQTEGIAAASRPTCRRSPVLCGRRPAKAVQQVEPRRRLRDAADLHGRHIW